ncbi:MAG: UDP-N-acetylmuramate dehydrogenase [Tissierellales bacterium]|nr:UDP-N-acetylmuramate dehydrogenase [Tissierellales bacterium]MBN2827594.1 UDP-N-acetylmuramate dehydrogenase [Tissierellales bacterium]
MHTIYNKLKENIRGQVQMNIIIKDYTYFKIGGVVDLFIEPYDVESLIKAIQIINGNIPFYIIGNGTNLLFSDNGYRGAIIKIGNYLNGINIQGNTLQLGAGTLLSAASRFAAENALTGMEFASGIPGYVGGAIAMNAGAYGGEMVDVVKKVVCLDYSGLFYELSKEEMNFRYRNSRVFDENLVVVSAELEFKAGLKNEIIGKMKDLNQKRMMRQPIDKPSAGSTFKRPAEGFAAKLIEDCGLKGLRYNGAMVSDKHCGFVINENHATASDVLSLMRIIRERVHEKFGIMLEPEVRIIGEEL